MNKGGYKIVNFNGATLSGTAVTLAGIYDQIVDEYDKPIMVSGVILNGELQDDAYASVKGSDVSVELTVYGGVITVTDDDEVSFAAVKSNTELAEDVNSIKSRLSYEITGVPTIQSLLSIMVDNDVASGRISGGLVNTIWGVGTVAGTFLMRRMNATSGNMLVYLETGTKILTVKFSFSDDTITYSGRYIYEGTEYTPA